MFLPTFFFYKREHLVFSNLNIPLVLSIRVSIRLKLLKLNKIMSDQGKRLMFFNLVNVFW